MIGLKKDGSGHFIGLTSRIEIEPSLASASPNFSDTSKSSN
jgi:hypothetical protein